MNIEDFYECEVELEGLVGSYETATSKKKRRRIASPEQLDLWYTELEDIREYIINLTQLCQLEKSQEDISTEPKESYIKGKEQKLEQLNKDEQ